MICVGAAAALAAGAALSAALHVSAALHATDTDAIARSAGPARMDAAVRPGPRERSHSARVGSGAEDAGAGPSQPVAIDHAQLAAWVEMLRHARSIGDDDGARATLERIRGAARTSPRSLVECLRDEVVVARRPSVADSLGDAVTVLRESPEAAAHAFRALVSESAALVGDPADRRFVADVSRWFGLVSSLGAQDPSDLDGFTGLLNRRDVELGVTRRALFNAVARLGARAFVPRLRSIVTDPSERIDDRVAAGRALAALDGIEGVRTCLSASRDDKDRRAKRQFVLAAAAAEDYRAAFPLLVESIREDAALDVHVLDSVLSIMMHVRTTAESEPAADFLFEEAKALLASDPEVVGHVLQALGSPRAPGIRRAVMQRPDIRPWMRDLAQRRAEHGDFVAACGAAGWARTSRDPREVASALRDWRSQPPAFRGVLINCGFALEGASDGVEVDEARREIVSMVREALSAPDDPGSVEDDMTLEAGIAASRGLGDVALAPDLQRVADDPSRPGYLRAQAAEVLKDLAVRATELGR